MLAFVGIGAAALLLVVFICNRRRFLCHGVQPHRFGDPLDSPDGEEIRVCDRCGYVQIRC